MADSGRAVTLAGIEHPGNFSSKEALIASWRWRSGGVLLSTAAALSGGGCGDTGAGDSVMVRDSTGVRILESPAPAWTEGEEWRLGSSPVVSIGMLDGPVQYQLQRVVGAVRAGSRGIVVADGGANAVRAYADDGALLWSVGGAGSGPGEFRRLHELYLYDDTLYAHDLMLQRMSVLDLDGRFVRSFSVADPAGSGYAEVVGRFDRGDWVLRRTKYARDAGASLTRGNSVFLRLAEGSTVADSFVSLPGPEQIVQPVGPGGAYVRRAPFARIPSALVSGDELVYGGAERYELAVYSPEGTLRRLIRRPIGPEPLTPRDLTLWESEVEAKRQPYSPSLPPMFHQPISSFDVPETKAAYGPVLVDRRGNSWVGAYALPQQQPTAWAVFSAEGEWLGRVSTPERFQPVDIGEDYVLGLFRDELDVEYVRLYPLTK